MKSLNISIANRVHLNKYDLILYLPHAWETIIFKLKNNFLNDLFYLYSKNFFFYVPLLKNFINLFCNTKLKIIHFKILFINNFFILYWTIFKNIFFSFSKVYFKKLKFKGKGYYIYKGIRNTIATQFGYSHMTRLYGFTVSIKIIAKTTIFLYGINKYDLFKMGKTLRFKRPISIFTGKGMRFNKQIIYKKTGKVSSYR